MLRTALRVVCVLSISAPAALISYVMISYMVFEQVFDLSASGAVVVRGGPGRLVVGVIALALGCAVAAAVWVRTKRLSLRAIALVTAAGAAVMLMLGGGALWSLSVVRSVHGVYDSDLAFVPPEDVNARLHSYVGVDMPREARDIRVLSIGGLSPELILKFVVAPGEAQRFLDGLLASFPMEQHRGTLPPAVTDFGRDKVWWTPRSDLPWWFAEAGGSVRFVQVDGDSGTVFVMCILR